LRISQNEDHGPLKNASSSAVELRPRMALSRCVRTLLLHVQVITSLIHDWAAMMGRSLIRHVQG